MLQTRMLGDPAGVKVRKAVSPPPDPREFLLGDLLSRQPFLAVINLVVAAVLVAVLHDPALAAKLMAWFTAMALIQLGRVGLWFAARQWRPAFVRARLAFCLGTTSCLVGLGWGFAGLLFGFPVGTASTMLVPFILAGISAGAMTALPTYPPSFYGFVWASLLPYAIRLASEPHTVARAMALVTLLYACALSLIGHQVHRTLRRLAELHLQNATLVRELDEARVGLEHKVERRTAELREANAALSREVAERRRSEERIRHLVEHDPLTNLPNRILLFDRLGQALARSRRFGTMTAVMMFDVDHFKEINDTLGHPAGDLILRELAGRIGAVTRRTDTVARLGGDEFALVAPDLTEEAGAAIIARKLLEACRKPFQVAGSECRVSISLGIALYPAHGSDADTLMRAADLALYTVKAEGRDHFRLYSQALRDALQERRQIEAELREAPHRGQLWLAYQPRFALSDRRFVGVEALLRWRHPVLGELRPDSFIPLAERSGAIHDLGRWVVATACTQARHWHDAGWPGRVSVNISAVEFRRPDLPTEIEDSLARTGLPPSSLEIEVTESACMDQDSGGHAEHGIAALKRLGVRLAIDDFGTGYSSLAYLKWLPFDVLKVDRSFIRNLAGDSRDEAIVTTIITLARQLDKTVVAEGVENLPQLELLGRLGCHEAQGFLLGRPMPADGIDALLAA